MLPCSAASCSLSSRFSVSVSCDEELRHQQFADVHRQLLVLATTTLKLMGYPLNASLWTVTKFALLLRTHCLQMTMTMVTYRGLRQDQWTFHCLHKSHMLRLAPCQHQLVLCLLFHQQRRMRRTIMSILRHLFMSTSSVSNQLLLDRNTTFPK